PAARTAIPMRPRRSCERRCGVTCVSCVRWGPTNSSTIATGSSASWGRSRSRPRRLPSDWRRSLLLLLQFLRDHRDVLVRLEWAAVPVLVGGEQLFLLHLLDRLAALQAARDERDDFVQPAAELLQIGGRREGPMAGDDLRVRRDLRQELVDGADHPSDAAAVADVEERETVRDEVIAHVDDVAFGEEDDRIAVRVGRRHVNRANRLAVEPEVDALLEGDHRQAPRLHRIHDEVEYLRA